MFLCRRSAGSGGGIGYVPPFETNIEMDSWKAFTISDFDDYKSAETKEIRESFTKTERLLYLILMIKHGSKSAETKEIRESFTKQCV
ncbi:hypothetical protein RCL_jg10937.t1 [Rhizophagus clarus]|uniref:Uncharacterized protein n=1 Tax=Rhizophagus clarus TaxID=94130 RepID=A0A8H3L5E7_9GLOM|nr:hypothetical protein RCL_jg10937.t1 [Rhizophagus clarus]